MKPIFFFMEEFPFESAELSPAHPGQERQHEHIRQLIPGENVSRLFFTGKFLAHRVRLGLAHSRNKPIKNENNSAHKFPRPMPEPTVSKADLEAARRAQEEAMKPENIDEGYREHLLKRAKKTPAPSYNSP